MIEMGIKVDLEIMFLYYLSLIFLSNIFELIMIIEKILI